jgi:hypothetical protein
MPPYHVFGERQELPVTALAEDLVPIDIDTPLAVIDHP